MIADATYKGLPLSDSAWKAHLELLKAVAAGSVPNLMSFELPQHQAWVAICQCGHVADKSSRSTDGSFRWAEWSLTPRGVAYLAALTQPLIRIER